MFVRDERSELMFDQNIVFPKSYTNLYQLAPGYNKRPLSDTIAKPTQYIRCKLSCSYRARQHHRHFKLLYVGNIYCTYVRDGCIEYIFDQDII